MSVARSTRIDITFTSGDFALWTIEQCSKSQDNSNDPSRSGTARFPNISTHGTVSGWQHPVFSACGCCLKYSIEYQFDNLLVSKHWNHISCRGPGRSSTLTSENQGKIPIKTLKPYWIRFATLSTVAAILKCHAPTLHCQHSLAKGQFGTKANCPDAKYNR